MNIQWYPGHMTKTRRQIEADLKLVDAVCEIVDARIPISSRNPDIDAICGNKPRIIVLNRMDLADPNATKRWLAYFRGKGYAAVATDCKSRKGIADFQPAVRSVLKEKIERNAARGMNKPLRVMIVGIPNVGKSTLINRLVGKNKVMAADKPGVTRGQQWVTIAKGLELLDTPGVLWPKFEDSSVGFALAATGAIKEDVFDRQDAVELLLEFMLSKYPEALAAKYAVTLEEGETAQTVMAKIATARGCLKAGGMLDLDKVDQLVLRDFRSGRLGRFTVDEP